MLGQHLLSEVNVKEFPPYFVRRPTLEPLYQSSIRLLQKLADHELVPEYRVYLGFRYIDYGDLLLGLERHDEAASQYRSAIATYEGLITGFGSLPEYLENLAKSEGRLADVLCKTGSDGEAEGCWKSAIEHRQQIMRIGPPIVRYRTYLQQDYERLAAHLEQCGRQQEARHCRRCAEELAKSCRL
jgi:tetratricopeptide (TPR) repeat protein